MTCTQFCCARLVSWISYPDPLLPGRAACSGTFLSVSKNCPFWAAVPAFAGGFGTVLALWVTASWKHGAGFARHSRATAVSFWSEVFLQDSLCRAGLLGLELHPYEFITVEAKKETVGTRAVSKPACFGREGLGRVLLGLNGNSKYFCVLCYSISFSSSFHRVQVWDGFGFPLYTSKEKQYFLTLCH